MKLNRTAVLTFAAGFLTAFALPVLAQFGGSFSDVANGDYFSNAVVRMSRLGIVRGYSNGRFGPNDGITRGQTAVMLERYDATAIEPLRDQIEELRKKANLGFCGDKSRQTGEQCDDGNQNDGDGCSHECIQETAGTQPQGYLCEGRYQIGQSYPSSDGCNTCTCTQNGSACTLRACVSSSSSLSSSRSSSSSSSGTLGCETEKNDFNNMAAANRSCTVDADCTLFIASCPFLTCGQPVRKDAISKLEDNADSYFMCKQQKGEQMACAGCSQLRAVCQLGLCTAK